MWRPRAEVLVVPLELAAVRPAPRWIHRTGRSWVPVLGTLFSVALMLLSGLPPAQAGKGKSIVYKAPYVKVSSITAKSLLTAGCGHTNLSKPMAFIPKTGIGVFGGGAKAADCPSFALRGIDNAGLLQGQESIAVPITFPASGTGRISVNVSIGEASFGDVSSQTSNCTPDVATFSNYTGAVPADDVNYSYAVCDLMASASVYVSPELVDLTTNTTDALVNYSSYYHTLQQFLTVPSASAVNEVSDVDYCYGPGNSYGYSPGCYWTNTSYGQVCSAAPTCSALPPYAWNFNAVSAGVFTTYYNDPVTMAGFGLTDHIEVLFTIVDYVSTEVDNARSSSALAWVNMYHAADEFTLNSITTT